MNKLYDVIYDKIQKSCTIVVLLIVFVFSFPLYATSLCDKNKTWLYQVIGMWENKSTSALYEARFVGSVVKNGYEYKELRIVRSIMNPRGDSQCFSEEELNSQWLFRQDGDKVWFDRWGEDILMYDFSIGDNMSFPGQQEDYPLDLIGEAVSDLLPDTTSKGIRRRCYTAASPEGKVYNPNFKCIEGIGATAGFLSNFYVFQLYGGHLTGDISPSNPGYYPTLIGVKDSRYGIIYGDEQSFKNFESIYSAVAPVLSDNASEPVYYNLQGQRISAPEKGQPCIERRGGTSRKIIR